MSKVNKVILASHLAIILGWTSTGHAGCTPSQVSGIWETAFSDGNSCRLKIRNNGVVDIATDKSICYDPDRGTSGLDSGRTEAGSSAGARRVSS